ncbi:MAG TPA: hypothetical protein VE620_10240 [Myxococcales bacterium]|nr:hypothetical protein [Myxococcales bacterium]
MPSDDLPEQFAPTGPKLSRFPIRPAPPVRPHLFRDEARFAKRLALLAGGSELAAWIWFARLLAHRGAVPVWAAFVFAALRVLRPFWAWLGTRLPRGFVAFTLLAVSLLLQGFAAMSFADGLAVAAAALPAVGDLCASAAADAVTIERRTTAYAWIDLGQGLGCGLGLALGTAQPGLAPLLGTAALLAGSIAVPDLRDRRTPRSTWPFSVRWRVLRTPLTAQLALLAASGGALAAAASARSRHWWMFLAPLLGMAAAARADAAARNALVVARAVAVVACVAFALQWVAPVVAIVIGLLALGAFCSTIPGAVARGAGEMERPVASSLGFSALALGAGLGLAWSVAA